MLNIINEIKKAFNGDAWHGNHVMQTLNNVIPEKAFQSFIQNVHSIIEIALHLISWTEEVSSRLIGHLAVEPKMGDWATIHKKTPQAWEKIIFNFKTVNEELIHICETIKDSQWDGTTNDERSAALGTGVTNAELLNGLVQHHGYHSGQVAL